MVQFNLSQREILLKLVYYGPALSGKTTNLQAVYELLNPETRGRLMTLDTANDRTLFFDMLPVFFQSQAGFKFKLKLYTVPGQVMHNSTRRIVLAGADGVAFIADAQRNEAKANNEAWRGMIENLKQNALDPTTLPIVIQFNKCDLPNIRSDEELEKMRVRSREPIFRAIATQKKGVLETLYALVQLTFRRLDAEQDFERKFGVGEKEFLRHLFAGVDGRAAGLPSLGRGVPEPDHGG
ncbi:MAG: GTPase domain-containing protein [Pseudomonadota bacterium]